MREFSIAAQLPGYVSSKGRRKSLLDDTSGNTARQHAIHGLAVEGGSQEIEVQKCERTGGHHHNLHDPRRATIGGGRDVSAVDGHAVGGHHTDGRRSSPLRRRAWRTSGGGLGLCHLSDLTTRDGSQSPLTGTTLRTFRRCHHAFVPGPTGSPSDGPEQVGPRPTP
jgi:hypothetical protein